VFKAHGSNNGPACGSCTAKDDYVESLGSMNFGVPDELEEGSNGAFNHERKRSELMETKVCVREDCQHEGAEQPLSNFRNQRGGKKSHACLDCINTALRKPHKKKRKPKQSVPKKDKWKKVSRKLTKPLKVNKSVTKDTNVAKTEQKPPEIEQKAPEVEQLSSEQASEAISELVTGEPLEFKVSQVYKQPPVHNLMKAMLFCLNAWALLFFIVFLLGGE